jgi:hypothetical protein
VDARAAAQSLAAGRAAIGASCLAAPELTMRAWLGADAGRFGARLLARALGAREVVLGAGALVAVARGTPVRPWIAGGAGCDGVDLTLTLHCRDRLPRAGVLLVGLLAGSGAALGTAAALALEG